MKQNVKLKQITLTQHEWLDALKVPTPHRNKKKYYKKEKHKGRGNTSFFSYIYNVNN